MKQKFFAQQAVVENYPGHVAICTSIRSVFFVLPPWTPSHVCWLIWHDRGVSAGSLKKLLYQPIPSRWHIAYLDRKEQDMDQEWLNQPRDHSDNPLLAGLYHARERSLRQLQRMTLEMITKRPDHWIVMLHNTKAIEVRIRKIENGEG